MIPKLTFWHTKLLGSLYLAARYHTDFKLQEVTIIYKTIDRFEIEKLKRVTFSSTVLNFDSP